MADHAAARLVERHRARDHELATGELPDAQELLLVVRRLQRLAPIEPAHAVVEPVRRRAGRLDRRPAGARHPGHELRRRRIEGHHLGGVADLRLGPGHPRRVLAEAQVGARRILPQPRPFRRMMGEHALPRRRRRPVLLLAGDQGAAGRGRRHRRRQHRAAHHLLDLAAHLGREGLGGDLLRGRRTGGRCQQCGEQSKTRSGFGHGVAPEACSGATRWTGLRCRHRSVRRRISNHKAVIPSVARDLSCDLKGPSLRSG